MNPKSQNPTLQVQIYSSMHTGSDHHGSWYLGGPATDKLSERFCRDLGKGRWAENQHRARSSALLPQQLRCEVTRESESPNPDAQTHNRPHDPLEVSADLTISRIIFRTRAAHLVGYSLLRLVASEDVERLGNAFNGVLELGQCRACVVAAALS